MRFFIRGFDSLDPDFYADLEKLTAYEYFESQPATGSELRARERFAPVLDYAFFAARLGWTPSQYKELTPIERAFVRKELETVTAERAGLAQDAIKLGIVNAYNGKNYRLFKKRLERDESITDEQIAQLKKAYEENPPWTPWSNNGRLHTVSEGDA